MSHKKVLSSVVLTVAIISTMNTFAANHDIIIDMSGPFISVGVGPAHLENSRWSRFPVDQPGLFQVEQPQISSTTVPVGSLALGYQFNAIPITLELSYNYFGQIQFNWPRTFIKAPNESSAGKVSTQTLMMNAYYNIPTHSRFTPYVGAGVGSHFTYTSYDFSAFGWFPQHSIDTGHTNNNGLSWDVLAGVNYALTQNWQIGARVSYTDLGSVTFNEITVRGNSHVERGIAKTNKLYDIAGMATLSYTFH